MSVIRSNGQVDGRTIEDWLFSLEHKERLKITKVGTTNKDGTKSVCLMIHSKERNEKFCIEKIDA